MNKKTMMRKIKTVAQDKNPLAPEVETGEDYNQNIISRHRSGWAGQTLLEEQTVLESTVRPGRKSPQRLAMSRLEKTHKDLLRFTDGNRSP